MTPPDPRPADRPPAGFVVEWYRPDPRPRLYRVWFRGSVILVGGLVLATAGLAPWLRDGQTREAAEWVLGLLGVLATAAAPLYVLIALQRVFSDETALILRSDALVVVEGEAERRLDWGDLMSACAAPDGALLLTLRDGEVVAVRQPSAPEEAEHLARRIEDVRRKALMGLLRAPRR